MKRLFDIIFSFIGLVCLSPILLIISLIIVTGSKGGVFFRGVRVGQHGKDFRIFKFRSMKPDCEGKGKWNVGDDDDRITPIGHFLRKSKVDELPQLINVLKGDMSFVGPRPELRYYTDMYTECEMAILDQKPGITDWASMANIAQFKGFTEAIDPDAYYLNVVRPLKLKLQLYYRNHHSFLGDIKCIFWTVYKVITKSDKLPKDVQEILDNYEKNQKK
ncbi:sugar transferase [Bacteroides stercorirosoris]|uniref:Sugar transferase involved in LPS biosynthesis (Colanic, teichoic acid) n=1 Tax=Bacteroides stercorirosoris TaxID=871324 RepID=A0A1M6IDP8_9BACE|nr:sugar transferase [Bacteroides stercorirosoris]SHJ32564.1 Sugar transferase involved in LPS biosynthesis (colanic, teichoic acid) [Bacteroides stercorirosoris]